MTKTILELVLRNDDIAKASAAYTGIRSAIAFADHLSPEALKALRERVVEAATTYPGEGADTPALSAANILLLAYACYLDAVREEAELVQCAQATGWCQ